MPPVPPPRPPAVPPRRLGTAAFAFQATEAWQCSLPEGGRVELVKVLGDGWSEVRLLDGSAAGLVPSAYVVEDARESLRV